MKTELVYLFLVVGYFIIVGLPVFLFIHKGRQSGKVTPKMAATLMTGVTVGVPLLLIMIAEWSGIFFKDVFLLILIFLGILFVWFSAYIGPFGIGWTGRWDAYIYSNQDKNNNPGLMPKKVLFERQSKDGITRSWRCLILMIIVPEIIILVVAQRILNNNLFTLIGAIVASFHFVTFMIIWRWKKKQLIKSGWHW